jgi:GNAT superfamily N-acetyltransferase
MPKQPTGSPLALRFEPVTPDRWNDLEKLFGERGACGGCWCMSWRKQRAEFVRDKGMANRASLHVLVKKGPPPGILAYDGETPVGWCAVAPRREYIRLANSRVLRPIDDAPVWSISCLFVTRPYRRRGVAVGLLTAAAGFVKRQGGIIVEGYPVLPTKGVLPDAFVWTGPLRAFLRAGFEEMPRWSESRPIVRCFLGGPA